MTKWNTKVWTSISGNTYISVNKCGEQKLKMKPQHRKLGNREHVLYVQCIYVDGTVYSTCKWDRIVRTIVQYSTYSSTVCDVISQKLSIYISHIIILSTVECGESTYDKSVLSYMRRYKSDHRNKMTIKNEQKFECRIIWIDDNNHYHDVISLIVIIFILRSSCHE